MQRHHRSGLNIAKEYICVTIPEQLSIFTQRHRSSLLRTIMRIHKIANRGNRYIELDFSGTKKIYSQGMLLLYAEISNILNTKPSIQFRCKKPRNNKASHVLHQIGIYEICKMKFKPMKNYTDVIHWRVWSGVDVIGKDFDSVVDQKSRELLHPEIDLYGGCIEATKNAKKHAYISPRGLSSVAHEKTSWWIFSQVKDGKLSVNICDLGIGIPKTLPLLRRNLYDMLCKKLGSSKNDAKLIEGAIQGKMSRSEEKHRGNGLPKIAGVAKTTQNAVLSIHSDSGAVHITKDKTETLIYKEPIPGTIISWTLPLGADNGHIDS